MDRREELSLPSSYYIQRSMAGPGPGPQRSIGVNSMSSMFENPYQANSFGSSLPPEQPPAISPRGVNLGAASVTAPPAEVVRRKRGRPRKYGPDGGGGGASLVLSPRSVGPMPSGKRGRGRPPGSGQKQHLSSLGECLSGSAGTNFTPHLITVSGGEDIAAKIMSFSQQISRAICVLSASGAVSAVTLQQPSTSGGNIRYEGHFEILCLSGSYLPSDNGGPHNRTGGLSISLASPDGRAVGGGVGGVLIAASHVQVILGSFLWGNSKIKNKAKETPKHDHPPGGGDPVAQSAYPRNQNLSPPSSVGVWPGSQSIDLDLMHE